MSISLIASLVTYLAATRAAPPELVSQPSRESRRHDSVNPGKLKSIEEIETSLKEMESLTDLDALERFSKEFISDSSINPRLKARAYEILSKKNVARYPEGVQILLQGLVDPISRDTCARALGSVSPSSRGLVANRLAPIMANKTNPASSRSEAIRSLGRLQASDSATVATFQAILSDTTDNQTLRFLCAEALLQIISLADFMKNFLPTDSEGKVVVLWSLGPYMAKNQQVLVNSPDERAAIQEFALANLKDADPRVREAAIQSITMIFSQEIRLGGPMLDALRSQLESASELYPNSALRKQADNVLIVIEKHATKRNLAGQ